MLRDGGEREPRPSVSPRAVQRWVRNGVFLACGLGLAYLVWRFELVRLPRAGCSPLLRLAPGDLLVFDTRARAYHTWDVVLFRGPRGELLLGELRPDSEGIGAPPSPAGDHAWIRTDRPDCPGTDSLQLGWIPRDALAGRLLLASGQF